MNKQLATLSLFLFCFVFLCSSCQNTRVANNTSNQNQNETVSREKSTAEKEDVSMPSVSGKDALNVTTEFWKAQLDKANEKRNAPTGDNLAEADIPDELKADGVIKQKAKLSEMVAAGYSLPLDFADLAEKRLKGELVELPMATENYVLDVGGSAKEDEFSSFSFDEGSVPLKPDSPKFATLKKLSEDFDGTKYDLSKPGDRKQMRMRLLRMVNPRAKVVIEEIASAYQKKFDRPLKINSMTRSMDYQIDLNKVSANSFKVNGKGALPPHLSGLTFDFTRKNLTAEEQNFVMQKLAEMEKSGKIDALIENGDTPVFHIFVYQDGKPPEI